MSAIEQRTRRLAEDEALQQQEKESQQQMDYEVRRSIERSRALWREKRKGQQDDDDYDVEVEYMSE